MTSFLCCSTGGPVYQFQIAETVLSAVRYLFSARSATPAEQLRLWRLETKKQTRILDRAIREIDRRNGELRHDLKTAASRRSVEDTAVHEFSLTHNNKARARIEPSKAHLSMLDLELQRHARTARMAQTFSSSVEVMKLLQEMVKVSELRGAATEMSRSMFQMGLIDAAIADATEDKADTDEEKRVTESILMDVIGKVENAPGTPNDALELDENSETELLMKRPAKVLQMAK